MKKLLLVLAVAGFVACNNSGESTPSADTTAVKVDSAVSSAIDTAKAAIDSAAAKLDTAKAAVDSLKK